MSSFDPRAAAFALGAADLAEPAAPVVARSLDEGDWGRLVAAVRAQRLEPQLAAAVAAGHVVATRHQREHARDVHAQAMATALLLDRELLEVSDLFESHGLDAIVLKGTAAAHLDRPDPARRSYGDVDMLVPGPHVGAAERLLTEAGGRRAHREPRPGYDRRFGKGASFRMPSGLEVDLHRTLALGPFGLAIQPRELSAGGETFALGGRTLRALDRPRRFLHACYHAVLGRARPRVVPLLDVAWTAPQDEHEHATVAHLAASWRSGAVVEHAAAVARAELGWEPSTFARWGPTELGITAQQQRWLAGYLGEDRTSARLTLSAVEAIDGWGARADYLRAVLWPSSLGARQAARRLVSGARSVVQRAPR